MKKIEKLREFFYNGKEKSVEDYQKAITDFGLINDGNPTLYGKEAFAKVKTFQDLGIYQTPIQFAKYLKFLEDFEINSYLEIGVFRGGTLLFMKYFLESRNPDVLIVGIDPNQNEHESLREIIWPNMLRCTSFDIFENGVYFSENREPFIAQDRGIINFDLVLIDGDHSYKWCMDDYINIGRFAKLCAFHDIIEPSCSDVEKFWNEVKVGKNYVEFTETLGGYKHHGIGVIIND
jgi:hypothetical protein